MTLSWPERVLRALAEGPAALLVLAEIVVLSLAVPSMRSIIHFKTRMFSP
jgi:hypothetical protein